MILNKNIYLVHARKLQGVLAPSVANSHTSFSTPISIVDDFVVWSIISTPLAC